MKKRKSEKIEKPVTEQKPGLTEDQITIQFIQECKQSGQTLINKFKGNWDDIEKQIRCVPPSDWDKKEYWQTKVYYPLQSKGSESAISNHSSISFPPDFFDIAGVEKRDKDRENNIKELISTILNSGNFMLSKEPCIQESCDIGLSWIKILAKPDGLGFDYIWRSAYVCLFDPTCGNDFRQARYWIDTYEKDISWLLSQSRKPDSLYYSHRHNIQQFLVDAQSETSQTDPQHNLETVKSIDGTQDLSIPKKYKKVRVDEFWGLVPKDIKKDGKIVDIQEEWRTITVINDKYIIRDDINPYGDIPAVPAITKARKYDLPGKGYFLNTMGLQNLMNTLINLGFDSQKMSSLDIAIVDDTKVADSSSIEMRPLAVWKMKDVNAAKLQRQQSSAIRDILMGVTLIDSIYQDATGLSRISEGTPSVEGGSMTDETLGQSRMKLQGASKRFIQVARYLEQTFIIPLIQKTFKYIKTPELFSQEAVDRLIGVNESEQPVINQFDGQPVIDPTSQQPMMQTIREPKLILAELDDEMSYDFKATGVTQFIEKMETLQKLKETLMQALSDPTLRSLTKIDELWRKILSLAQIPDYDDFLKSPEEVESMKQQLIQSIGGGQDMAGMLDQGINQGNQVQGGMV